MRKKLVVSLGLFTLIASSISAGAYAGANLEEVKAYLNKGIKIKLNGQPLRIKDSAGQRTYLFSPVGDLDSTPLNKI